MRFLIDAVYLLAILLISPKVLYRCITQGRYRSGWPERLGKVSRRRPQDKCIWIHAVSVGEVNATRTLVRQLKESLSDYEICISSTTDTGHARAQELYGEKLAVFFFPLDLSGIMKKAFKRIRPNLCILMELEVWPNFSLVAEDNGIPIIVANGRLSDRSYPRYKLIRPVTRWMFGRVRLFLAQSKLYAKRFEALGCQPERIRIVSSLKYDTAEVTDIIKGAEQIASQLRLDTHQLWVAGGTGPGEEKIIMDIYMRLKAQPGLERLQVIIVPRKPERFDAVASLIASYGAASIRYSEYKISGRTPAERPDVVLGDTMGDLRKFYSLATVVFTGRSMVKMGGSDMMEPTALGKPTVFGPYTFNFRQTVEALLEGEGALLAQNEQQLYDAVLRCLIDNTYNLQLGRRGREVIIHNQGATQKTVEAVKEILSE